MSESELASQSAPQLLDESPSLIDTILQEARIPAQDETYPVAKRGIKALIKDILDKPEVNRDLRVHKVYVDEMIKDLDKNISTQLDKILHHEDFQRLESAWRGLKFLIARTNFRENIKVELLNISKEKLLEDLTDASEIVKSGLHRHVYSDAYGTFGGHPFAAIIGNYQFSNGAQDITLLQKIAAVAGMAHAPFISSVAPSMFGIDSYQALPGLKDLKPIFEGPKYDKWRSFRETEDARYVGLTAPRFLLRLPYGAASVPVKSFGYEESVADGHESYLWGNSAFAFATKLADSFAKYRWCPNIIGPQSGGAVEDLPLYHYESMGQTETKCPTETMITDRRELEIAEQGFIALTMRKGSDNATFFSANSVQKPQYFGISAEAKNAELNYKLGTQLPYMFIISRMAHYIKVMQREDLGSWTTKSELQTKLSNWIKQYVADQDNPQSDVRSRRPLRQAQVTVEDVEGEPGWYRVDMAVKPHFKYMGADFTLTLKGKLDKK